MDKQEIESHETNPEKYNIKLIFNETPNYIVNNFPYMSQTETFRNKKEFFEKYKNNTICIYEIFYVDRDKLVNKDKHLFIRFAIMRSSNE